MVSVWPEKHEAEFTQGHILSISTTHCHTFIAAINVGKLKGQSWMGFLDLTHKQIINTTSVQYSSKCWGCDHKECHIYHLPLHHHLQQINNNLIVCSCMYMFSLRAVYDSVFGKQSYSDLLPVCFEAHSFALWTQINRPWVAARWVKRCIWQQPGRTPDLVWIGVFWILKVTTPFPHINLPAVGHLQQETEEIQELD